MEWPAKKQMVVAVLALVVGLCAAGQGAVIYVDDDADGADDGASWPNAFRYLQDALVVAQAGDEIRVAQGIYRPDQGAGREPGYRGATFLLLDGVGIKGGFAGVGAIKPDARDIVRYETILSGDLAGDDVPVGAPGDLLTEPTRAENSLRVVRADSCSRLTVLDGFTITSAYAPDRRVDGGAGLYLSGGNGPCCPSIRDCTFVGNAGGAMYASDASPELIDCVFVRNAAANGGAIEASMAVDSESSTCEFVVSRCTFTGNVATKQGGALYGYAVYGRAPSVTGIRPIVIDDCAFAENAADSGAAMYVGRSQPTEVTNCRFTRNSASGRGGAIYGNGGEATLVDCRFEGNWANLGGAIHGDVPVLKGCQFTGNVAYDRGGAVDASGALTCENCLFAGNLSWGGTAAVYSQGESLFTNCTFADNRSSDGYVVLVSGGRAGAARCVFSHCILWGLANPLDPTDWLLSRTGITFSDIQGAYPGEGNLDIDPLFVRPGSWDFNGTPEDLHDDVYFAGDYHLQSQAGHWDSAGKSWVADEATSLCIDAGEPTSPIGDEPFPNGGVVNLGAYGGTAEASRSYFGEPVSETHMAGDINGDGTVGLLDLLIVVLQWTEGVPPKTPSVVIVEPQDGTVFEGSSTPILIRVQITDPGFDVTNVRIEVTHESDSAHYSGSYSARKGADGWSIQWSPPVPQSEPVERNYTITAEASDSGIGFEVSSPVVITVRPLP